MRVSRLARSGQTTSFRRMAAVALATGACGFSALGFTTASADAENVRAKFLTPVYQMNCTTTTSQDNSYGSATCTGLGKWRVAVSCSFGLTYTSLWYINWPDQTQTATAGSCWWGVSSVSVQESTS
jgi:hypothetical protein